MNAVLYTHDRWRVVPREIKDNETLISIEDNEVVYGNKKEEAEQEEDITPLIPAFLIPLFRFHPYSFKSFPDCSLYSLVSNTGALSLLRSSIVVISPLLAGIGNDAYRIVDHV